MKQISIHTSVYNLCTEHPEIINIMKEAGFEHITQTGMLQTAGRVMTIAKGSRMKSIPLETIKTTFENHGFQLIGEENDNE